MEGVYDECMASMEPLSVVDGWEEREQCGLFCTGKATYRIYACTHTRTHISKHAHARPSLTAE